MTHVTARDIEVLIELFDKSRWDVLKLETAGVRLHLSKNAADGTNPLSVQLNGHASAHDLGKPPSLLTSQGATPRLKEQAAAAPYAPRLEPTPDEGHITVRAPNLGTFYRSPKPGAPPYVEVGQEVDAETDLCLIEVMKLFTTVRAGVRGVVRQVCVADSEMVEGEQPLFVIEPRG